MDMVVRNSGSLTFEFDLSDSLMLCLCSASGNEGNKW